MKRYRIYTEEKNREEIEEIIACYYEGYTIFDSKGYWRGKDRVYSEKAICIEIITDGDSAKILRLCSLIKEYNQQEAVLLTGESVESELI